MVFNGDVDDQDLCTLADDMAGSNDVSFPLKQKARFANLGVRQLKIEAWKAYGGWILDDSVTDLPIATRQLDANTTTFYFPSFIRSGGGVPNVQDLFEVEVLRSGGSWDKLLPITLEDIASRGSSESEFQKTAGNPTYYRPVGNGFKIYPMSDTTRVAGLRIHVADDTAKIFTPTATNTAPPIDSLFHESVAVFMAWQYSKINTMQKKTSDFGADWAKALVDVGAHYARKYREMFPGTIKHRRDVVSQYT